MPGRLPPASFAASALLACAVLSGCSDRKPPAPRPEQDPAVSGALNEQLMTDPDLARINPDNRALVGGGPAAAPIPLEDRSPEAIARARADAARLLGNNAARAPAPTGTPFGDAPRDTPALAVLAALGRAAKPCADALEYGFAWAARLPAAMPIYPRGHAQDAAGTDRPGCALRAVTYVTPVPASEVADFYWTAAARAGLAAEHHPSGSGTAVVARKGQGSAAAFIHARDDGLTEVDLVTSRM